MSIDATSKMGLERMTWKLDRQQEMRGPLICSKAVCYSSFMDENAMPT
jgi:hypothetical protein